jgi:hypothetical protein
MSLFLPSLEARRGPQRLRQKNIFYSGRPIVDERVLRTAHGEKLKHFSADARSLISSQPVRRKTRLLDRMAAVMIRWSAIAPNESPKNDNMREKGHETRK